MKIAFVSNFLSHHQIPFSDAISNMQGVEYSFIAVCAMDNERRTMGWRDIKKPYEIRTYTDSESENRAKEIINDADVVILGSAPDSYIIPRLKAGKLTFKYAERFYKRGLSYKNLLHAIAGAWLHHGRFQKYPLYMLCASAYTAGDAAVFHNYIGRTYKWGYFPEAKEYAWINEKESETLPHEVSKEIFTNVKALSISKIAGVVSNGSDNIIISKFIGLSSVGVASNYTMIINSLNGILWNGLSSLTSSFGNFNVDSTIEQRRKLFNELFLCSYWLYGFMTIGIITLANSFIELWVGPDYLVSKGVVLALILITYISGINFPAYTYQSTLGMFDKMKLPYVLFAVFNILLSILLGKSWGLFGVYIATSISRLCTSEVSSGYYVYRYGLKLSPLKYLTKYVISFVILILNVTVTNYIVSLVQTKGVIGFIIKTVICTVVCNLIYFVCFFRTVEFQNLLMRAKGLLSSRRK